MKHMSTVQKKGKNTCLVHLKQLAGKDIGADETKGQALQTD